MKGKELNCLRCEAPMAFARREKFQLGQTGWILGDWPNLLAGSLQMDIYVCPDCGKIEFFRAEGEEPPAEDSMAQQQCPRCGKMHDLDDPKCPFCKYNYYE